MGKLNVTIVQANQVWEDKVSNLAHYEALLTQVAQTDLVLLPEMFNTGFSMNAASLYEEMESSSSIQWLKKMAEEKNAAFYTSLIIKENNQFFNRGVFVEPSGQLSYYDKRKTFGLAGEDNVFASGNKEVIVHFRGWNIRLQICYDLRFPEIALNKHVNGQAAYDLLLYVANWPERRSMHWRNLLPARAIENQCYLAAVNRVGVDAGGLNYSGDSCVIDLHGNRLVDCIHDEKVATIELSMEELNDMRKKLPFLKDRH
jgi:omega-amidase